MKYNVELPKDERKSKLNEYEEAVWKFARSGKKLAEAKYRPGAKVNSVYQQLYAARRKLGVEVQVARRGERIFLLRKDETV